jgi:hypothetical protein
MTHDDLVKRADRWLRRTKGCSVAFTEFTTFAVESPDAIGFSSDFSVLIECKASRSDFHADKQKIFRRVPSQGMGQLRYFMAPAGLISPEELPDKWGLLEVHARHVKVVREAKGFADRNRPNEIRFLVSMLRRAQLRIDQPLSEWLRFESKAKGATA